MRLPSPRPRALARGFFVRLAARRGITLFEVVVSVAIFLLAVAVTAQALSQASELATRIEHQNEAMHLAQSQMARVIAGVTPLTSQDAFTPFEHNPDYQWRMTAEEAEMTGLFNVQIWVQHVSSGVNSEVQLCQKVFDPRNRGSTADLPGGTTTDGSSGLQTPASGISGGS